MAIPELNDEGYLPPGVHDCTLVEIKDAFGLFQRSDRRCRLYEKLEVFFAEACSTQQIVAVIVDGSFTTAKDEPEDIDLIVVLNSDHDFSAQLRPFEYNILSRREVRRKFRFDVLVAQIGEPELDDYVDFFTQIRGMPEKTKGMLRVVL